MVRGKEEIYLEKVEFMGHSEIKISVVIPVFNREKQIPRCGCVLENYLRREKNGKKYWMDSISFFFR